MVSLIIYILMKGLKFILNELIDLFTFVSLITYGLAIKIKWIGRKAFSPLQEFSHKSAVLTLKFTIITSKQP